MFKPIGKRVLVKRIEEANTTISGIIIPDDAKEKPNKGIIVNVSDDITEVSVNDLIVFTKYAGSEITLEGVKHIVLNLEDILGVF